MDELSVIVCGRAGEAPCGELRAAWLAEMHAAKELVVPVGSVLPLREARAAHEMLAGTRARKRGKIVLHVAG